jgi:hypothetical protein
MSSIGLLRVAGLGAAATGAVGSVALMLHAGRHNNSRVLLVIFALWVLSPFVALVLADLFSRRWSLATRAMVYGVMLVVALASLASYGYVSLGPPRAKIAVVFVVVPPVSWALIAMVVAIGALISRRVSRRAGGVFR